MITPVCSGRRWRAGDLHKARTGLGAAGPRPDHPPIGDRSSPDRDPFRLGSATKSDDGRLFERIVVMNKAIAALLIGSTLVAGLPAVASAQPRSHGGDRGHSWSSGGYRGGDYRGGYRVGGYYPHYNSSRYYIRDYRAYRLPPPRYGYRYYRDDDGDIVMAAIASGIIGLIIGSSISDHHQTYAQPYGYYPPPPPRPYYGYPPPHPYPYYGW
jgi:Ni/Co efflux regulator RcnB